MARKIDYSKLFTLRSDGRYQGTYTNGNGRHYLYSKDPAKLYAKLQAAQSEPAIPTFGEVAEQWWVEHVETLERGTQKTYKSPYEKAVANSGDVLVTDITAADISAELLREKAHGFSYKHAATLKSVYKQILDYAIVKNHIAINPAVSVKVPRGMTKGHIEAPEEDIVHTVKQHLGEPFGDFVAVLLYTGMRTEEAAALQWGDIGSKTINVRRAVDLHGTPRIKDTKTEAGKREIPLLNPLRPYLKRPKGVKDDDFVFNIDGKLLTRGQINSRWINWCKAAGLAEKKQYDNRHRGEKSCTRTEWRPKVSPHQFRHLYATILYEQGIDEIVAMDLMGHSDISVTKSIYTSLRKKHKESQLDRLNNAF